MEPDAATVLGAISDRLARIEVKLDRLMSDHGDHETRIRSLERARWVMIGAATAAGGIAGEIARFLGS